MVSYAHAAVSGVVCASSGYVDVQQQADYRQAEYGCVGEEEGGGLGRDVGGWGGHQAGYRGGECWGDEKDDLQTKGTISLEKMRSSLVRWSEFDIGPYFVSLQLRRNGILKSAGGCDVTSTCLRNW